jgi:hypothetical protein
MTTWSKCRAARNRAARAIAFAAFASSVSFVATPAGAADDTQSTLRARYESLSAQLAASPFKRPLVLQSKQEPGTVQGDIDALIEHPFAQFQRAVHGAAQWCDILILHLNVKDCSASLRSGRNKVIAQLGGKHDDTGLHRIEFTFDVLEERPDYVEIGLAAESGPLGTKNYRIRLAATAIDTARTFVHFAYSYAYGAAARFAMKTYMNTAGAEKVGFTVIDRHIDGTPVLVRDVRGALERNAMRYFLAVDACVSTASVPDDRKFEERVTRWFDETERYPQQLHEIDRGEYLATKLNGSRRQHAAQ